MKKIFGIATLMTALATTQSTDVLAKPLAESNNFSHEESEIMGPFGDLSLKPAEVVACLNNNTLAYIFATFFNQSKGYMHQFPDLTSDGEYMFLDMSSPVMAEASRNSLVSACYENPDLDLLQYAIQTDFSGVSGPIHEADYGRQKVPPPEPLQ